ncbi:Uncharacterized protein TCM_041864 [Theobroma cacao]|uniref:Uncharacterized protein n=1 Tax=Theobroma cacao TaxID=3641 RepID=A0A061GXC2_THECC|nr:Uncharacterized protein TCM_041864 [Theobroma cacao]
MQAKNKGITIYLIQPVAAKARLVLHLYNSRINRLKEIVIKPEKKKKNGADVVEMGKARSYISNPDSTTAKEPILKNLKKRTKGHFPKNLSSTNKSSRIQNLKNKDVSSIKSCKERNGDVKVGANFRPNRVITMTFLVV